MLIHKRITRVNFGQGLFFICPTYYIMSGTMDIRTLLSTSIGFVIALAINDAMKRTFSLMKVDDTNLLGAWVYAVCATGVGILMIYAIKGTQVQR